MARLPDKEPIYEAADVFRERCLEQQGSLLWPDEVGWTPDNLSTLYGAFIGNSVKEGGDFLGRWELQLAELPPEVHRVAADALTVYYLFPTGISSEKKLSNIRKVCGWKISEQPDELHLVETAYSVGGVGSAGRYYRQKPWLQVGFYIKFAEELQRQQVDAGDYEACRELAKEVDGILPKPAIAARHILNHLLFPAKFERIATKSHKQKLLREFTDLAGSYDDVDEGIAQVRAALEEEAGREGFDFYRDTEIKRRWNPDDEYADTSRKGDTDADPEEAGHPNVWIEKSHVTGIPHRESGPNSCGQALWSSQRAEGGADIYRFMREVSPGDIVLHLTDDEAFTGASRVAEPVEELDDVSDKEWATGPSYRVQLEDYRSFDPPLSRDVFFSDPYAQRLLKLREEGVKNLFYTNDPELRQGAYLTQAPEELVSILNDAYRSVSGSPLVDEIKVSSQKNPAYSLVECASETGFDLDRLERWVRAIERKGQAIFYGPPGTGKTFVAEKLARHIVGEGDGFHDLVQFHPSYAYEDFIQGIRPEEREDGELHYPTVPGRFLQFCSEAQERTDRCVLIIDEINRANLSRVFGELMYLLEYRDEREVPLSGGGTFDIPENVRIIGTMNTADRSIALVDHALRRRFAFLKLYPDFDLLRHYHDRNETGFDPEPLIVVLDRLNRQINDPNYEVGITFFMRDDITEQLEDIWRMEIVPYLEEYFFDQKEKVDEFRWDRIEEAVTG